MSSPTISLVSSYISPCLNPVNTGDPIQGYDEASLLQLIAEGDEQAFASLFHAWRDKLYFFILRITNSPQIAEDLVQDVFVKLWLNRDKLGGVRNFNGWLYRVSHNQAISGMRRMGLETTILAQMKKEATDASLPTDEALLLKQLQEKLQEAIDKLPPQQKLVYTLSRIEGLKQEEIASHLHLSVSTVKNHMTEALRNLRKNLGRDYPVSLIYMILLLSMSSPD